MDRIKSFTVLYYFPERNNHKSSYIWGSNHIFIAIGVVGRDFEEDNIVVGVVAHLEGDSMVAVDNRQRQAGLAEAGNKAVAGIRLDLDKDRVDKALAWRAEADTEGFLEEVELLVGVLHKGVQHMG